MWTANVKLDGLRENESPGYSTMEECLGWLVGYLVEAKWEALFQISVTTPANRLMVLWPHGEVHGYWPSWAARDLFLALMPVARGDSEKLRLDKLALRGFLSVAPEEAYFEKEMDLI